MYLTICGIRENSMPYITEERRRALKYKNNLPSSAGELNYLFTELIKSYLRLKGESYQTYNDVVGALEGSKLELYRRKVVPYEDKKITENGDVYVKRGDVFEVDLGGC